MATLKNTTWMLLFLILVGGLFGTLLGDILRALTPEGTVRNFFLRGLDFGVTPPFTLDLKILALTIGFTIKINILGIIGIFLGLFIYKQA